MNRVNLREIFEVIDNDSIKKISQIDFEIIYKKIRKVNISP